MTTKASAAQPWPATHQLAFRFVFILFIAFIFFNPNGGAPFLNETYHIYIQPMHKLMVWMGAHVLHLAKPITVFTNGSGDTTYNYLVVLFCFILALTGAALWTLASRKPANYDRLYYWLLVVLRFYVGLTMLSYGSVKIVKLQFPFPGPGRMLEPYGDSSPMALAWTFIGYSKGYNYFTGTAELACGILLLFRRTTLLGAIIGLTVIANIVAINYCFDVPVKIVSTALLLMVIFIILKDHKQIIAFFFLNKIAEPINIAPKRFNKRWKNITLVTFKYLLITYMLLSISGNLVYGVAYGDNAKHPVLYGMFNTRNFVLNKDSLPPLTTDTSRWRRLVISGYGGAKIYLMNDSTRSYSFTANEKFKTITMASSRDSTVKYVFDYTLSKDSILQLNGRGPHGSISVTLKRFNEKNFPLARRGFHWVNEFPFNR